VTCSLPFADIGVDVDVNVEFKPLSTDYHVDDVHSFRSSSPKSNFASTSTFVHEREPSHVSGHATLNDMFVSRRVTGVRASIFHCSQDHLRKLCVLHGLDVSPLSNTRDTKISLLSHVLNGDCFASEKFLRRLIALRVFVSLQGFHLHCRSQPLLLIFSRDLPLLWSRLITFCLS
jgi:hypothetical protein